jgi:RHS repeat-associated protein
MNQTRERFVTDSVGNRLTKEVNSQTVTYTYVTGTNKIQEITGPVSYTYDANGNITGIGSKVLTYNQNNRLIRVEENSNILGEYTYNGMGKRVIKTAGGVTTVFHYDFNGNIIGESDQDGNFIYEYLYKGGSRLAFVDVASGEIYSFLNDRLGTPQMLADSTNTIVWEGIYKPFGEAEVNPNSSAVNNFRFPGQYFDQETGLHYNYHRYYDPYTSRYLRPDPIGLSGGINLFLYTENNPVNLVDPEGLWRIPDYVSISINITIPNPITGTVIGWTGQVEMDRYLNVYVSPLGGNIGKSITVASASGTFGWLNVCETPSEEKMNTFLAGHSINISAGNFVGGGLTWVPGVGTATEVGIFIMPQAGVSYNYSFPVGQAY